MMMKSKLTRSEYWGDLRSKLNVSRLRLTIKLNTSLLELDNILYPMLGPILVVSILIASLVEDIHTPSSLLSCPNEHEQLRNKTTNNQLFNFICFKIARHFATFRY